MKSKKPAAKTADTKPAPAEPKVVIPMTAGKGAAQKVAKETARIAAKAIARVDKANPDESKVSVGKKKSKAAKRSAMSGLDAAAKVLADTGKPMTTQEMVEAMASKGLWKSNGATPHATIYAAIIREIAKKGSNGRFRKTDRGHFTVAKSK